MRSRATNRNEAAEPSRRIRNHGQAKRDGIVQITGKQASETEKARSWGWVGHGSEEGTTLVQLLHGNVQIWLPLLGVRLGEGGHNASTTGQPAVRRPQPAKQLEASGFTSRLGSIPPSLSIPFPVQLLNVYHSTRASRERARETSWVRIRARSMECAERGVSSQLLAGTATQIRTPVLVPCDAP
jgi:hypothetical protein